MSSNSGEKCLKSASEKISLPLMPAKGSRSLFAGAKARKSRLFSNKGKIYVCLQAQERETSNCSNVRKNLALYMASARARQSRVLSNKSEKCLQARERDNFAFKCVRKSPAFLQAQ